MRICLTFQFAFSSGGHKRGVRPSTTHTRGRPGPGRSRTASIAAAAAAAAATGGVTGPGANAERYGTGWPAANRWRRCSARVTSLACLLLTSCVSLAPISALRLKIWALSSSVRLTAGRGGAPSEELEQHAPVHLLEWRFFDLQVAQHHLILEDLEDMVELAKVYAEKT
jgi:hypothetical protein